MNNDIYPLVALILQTAQAYNITIDGGAKYNVPSTVDMSFLNDIGAAAPENLTSYSLDAIAGADILVDDSVTIKDVFDVIVNITREVTPTCGSSTVRSYPLVLLTYRTKSEPSGILGTCKKIYFLRVHSDNSTYSYRWYKWPVSSVERLPPPSPKQLKIPVLVIGNSVRAFHSQTNLSRSLTTTNDRPIPSRRMRARKVPLTSLAKVLSYSSNSVSVIRLSLRPRVALWASWSITLRTLRFVLFMGYDGRASILIDFAV